MSGELNNKSGGLIPEPLEPGRPFFGMYYLLADDYFLSWSES